MPYLASGGIGGAALIAIGVTVYISWEHVQDRAALSVLLQRLDEVESTLRDMASPVLESPEGAQPSSSTNGSAKRPRKPRAPRSITP
jgi:hypothetical protein